MTLALRFGWPPEVLYRLTSSELLEWLAALERADAAARPT